MLRARTSTLGSLTSTLGGSALIGGVAAPPFPCTSVGMLFGERSGLLKRLGGSVQNRGHMLDGRP